MNVLRPLTTVLLAATAATVALLPGAAGHADAGLSAAAAGCDIGTLRGGYAISGQGAFAGSAIRTIGRLVFDGKGRVGGAGVAVLDAPSAVEPYDMTDGRYTVRPDCTGTLDFFVHHHTLSPIDHFHTAEIVISGGGAGFDMAYTALNLKRDSPSLPVESILWTARKQ